MNKNKSKPLRKCIVTRETLPKKELVRIVKTPEGEIKIDLTGKLNGRGAYIKPDIEVFNKAKKSKLLERALKTQIPSEFYDELEKEILEGWD